MCIHPAFHMQSYTLFTVLNTSHSFTVPHTVLPSPQSLTLFTVPNTVPAFSTVPNTLRIRSQSKTQFPPSLQSLTLFTVLHSPEHSSRLLHSPSHSLQSFTVPNTVPAFSAVPNTLHSPHSPEHSSRLLHSSSHSSQSFIIPNTVPAFFTVRHTLHSPSQSRIQFPASSQSLSFFTVLHNPAYSSRHRHIPPSQSFTVWHTVPHSLCNLHLFHSTRILHRSAHSSRSRLLTVIILKNPHPLNSTHLFPAPLYHPYPP